MLIALVILALLWALTTWGIIAADKRDERADEAWRKRQPWHPDNLR